MLLFTLNVIQPRHVAADIKDVARGSQGFINIASDAINVSAKYQNIIENLLGNTIIVENLKHANELARAIRYRTRIVTLEGDVVNPGGSMTGGGARKTKSILSQKMNYQQCEINLKIINDKQQNLNVSLKNKTQAEQLSEQYFSASQQYNNLKEQVHHHELELDRLKTQEAHLKMNMKSLNLKKMMDIKVIKVKKH